MAGNIQGTLDKIIERDGAPAWFMAPIEQAMARARDYPQTE
jgi:hypothetical protein